MPDHAARSPLSLAEKSGAVLLLLGYGLLPFHPGLAIAVFGLFPLLCLTAPFCPRFAFFLPIVCRGTGKAGRSSVAITLDDSPNPASTPVLLELLARYGLTATFFVIGDKAARHPELVSAILAGGHSIGNHSARHDPLLMLRSQDTLRRDILRTQEVLRRQGVVPRVFRPPAGITSSRLKRVLEEMDLTVVNYSCQAFDRGNRNITNLAEKILSRLRPGGIVMLHDLPPKNQDMAQWQAELERIFSVVRSNDNVVSLEEMIGQPVMERLPPGPLP